jgi:hypothetical protein
MGWYSRSHVYILRFEEDAPLLDFVSDFAFFQSGRSYVYEVQPDGDLERDPAGGAHPSYWRCARARTIQRLYSPS